MGFSFIMIASIFGALGANQAPTRFPSHVRKFWRVARRSLDSSAFAGSPGVLLALAMCGQLVAKFLRCESSLWNRRDFSEIATSIWHSEGGRSGDVNLHFAIFQIAEKSIKFKEGMRSRNFGHTLSAHGQRQQYPGHISWFCKSSIIPDQVVSSAVIRCEERRNIFKKLSYEVMYGSVCDLVKTAARELRLGVSTSYEHRRWARASRSRIEMGPGA